MQILVTGGLGGVGRPLVQRLLRNGHAVRVLDRKIDNPIDGAECVAGEVTDFATMRDGVRGMQAVIHLAALTHPAAGPAPEIFHINVSGTYNVYEAAAQEGIKRVVCASSINALGYNFGVEAFEIRALPMDESHPSHTTDVYSLSKQMVEDIGAYYWRRDRISGVQLRLPFVYSEAHAFAQMFKKFSAAARGMYAEFVAKPESEQRALIEQVITQRDAARAERLSEKPWDQRRPATDGPPKFDPLMALGMGYTDFWAIIGSEDAAQAFEKGATASYEGSHPLYVCEDENALGMPSAMLARLFFPKAAVTQPLDGVTNLVSFARAQQLLGFKPEHHVRDWLTS